MTKYLMLQVKKILDQNVNRVRVSSKQVVFYIKLPKIFCLLNKGENINFQVIYEDQLIKGLDIINIV